MVVQTKKISDDKMPGSRKYPYPTTDGIGNSRGVGGQKPGKIQRRGGLNR